MSQTNQNILMYLTPTMLLLITGFCVYLVQEVHDIRVFQARTDKLIYKLDTNTSKIEDHEFRLRILENRD